MTLRALVRQIGSSLNRTAYDQALADELEAHIELHVAKSGACVQLSVTDDGPGMSPELLGKLGQPFASESEGGTGLGILLAESVTRQHGGELRFESEPGKGVRALLELPFGVAQSSAGAS